MSDAPRTLRRSLNLLETTLGGVGIILGAGIYALVGAVAGEAGNGTWLSFLLAAAMSATIGLCYAELASMFPRAGADYEYTRRALGGRSAFVVGWLMVIGNIIAAATVALGFAGYVAVFLDVDVRVTAVVALAVATAIAFYGIEETVRVTIVGTLVEVAGLALVIAIGVPHLGEVDFLDFNKGVGGVLSGAALVMFAFLGFSQIATLAEEAEDARRVVPLAMVLSIAVTAALYVLVAVAAVAELGWEALSASEAPLAAVAASALGDRASDLVGVIALFSTANTMLLLLVAASRMVYGMASEAALPRFLAWVHPGRRTPARAILLSWLLASAFALSGEIAFVAGATNFAVFVGFAAVCVSLVVLRRRWPDAPRPFAVPLTVLGVPPLALLGVAFVVVMTAQLKTDVLILGAVLFAAGVAAAQALSLWHPAQTEG